MHVVNTIGMRYICKDYKIENDLFIMDSFFIADQTDKEVVIFYEHDTHSKIMMNSISIVVKYAKEIKEKITIPVQNVAEIKDANTEEFSWTTNTIDDAFKVRTSEYEKMKIEGEKSIDKAVEKLIEFINIRRVRGRNHISKAAMNDLTWLIQNPLDSGVIIKLKKFIMKHKPLVIDANYFKYWKDEYTERYARENRLEGVEYDKGSSIRGQSGVSVSGSGGSGGGNSGCGLSISGSSQGNGIYVDASGNMGIGQSVQAGIQHCGGETGLQGIQGMTGLQGVTGAYRGFTGSEGCTGIHVSDYEKEKQERFKVYNSITDSDDDYKKRRPKPTPFPPPRLMPFDRKEMEKRLTSKNFAKKIKEKLGNRKHLRGGRAYTSHLGPG